LKITSIRFLVDNVQYDDFRKGLPPRYVWRDRPLPKTPAEVQLYMRASEIAFADGLASTVRPPGSTKLVSVPQPTYRITGKRAKTLSYWDDDFSRNVTEHLIEGEVAVVLHDREDVASSQIVSLRAPNVEVIGTLRGDMSWYDGKLFAPTRGLIEGVHEVPTTGDARLFSAIISMQISETVKPVRPITWEATPVPRETR
jgi:hypothetical protein